MNSYPKALNGFSPHLFYVFGLPAFFLLSVLLYEPSHLVSLMHTGETPGVQLFSFNISIVTAIIFVVMLLSRLLFFLLRKKLDMTLGWFAMWCVMETVLISSFVALYLTLMDKGTDSFFLFIGRTLSALGSVLIIPYLILTLAFALAQARNSSAAEPESRLKFYDSRHQLKFITSAQSLMYLEANENYVIIHFDENGEEKKYQLRNTLKSVEPLCEKAGFVRTHRGFIVNPAHVRLIRKEPGGFFFADIGTDRPQGIPVSKKYYDNLTASLL
ncbi:MAG: LytTR family transcriptional regulator [Bacteroidales bacterium]|nr:LytTR family transcriptional regulator [Bacteroidales bacterium]